MASKCEFRVKSIDKCNKSDLREDFATGVCWWKVIVCSDSGDFIEWKLCGSKREVEHKVKVTLEKLNRRRIEGRPIGRFNNDRDEGEMRLDDEPTSV